MRLSISSALFSNRTKTHRPCQAFTCPQRSSRVKHTFERPRRTRNACHVSICSLKFAIVSPQCKLLVESLNLKVEKLEVEHSPRSDHFQIEKNGMELRVHIIEVSVYEFERVNRQTMNFGGSRVAVDIDQRNGTSVIWRCTNQKMVAKALQKLVLSLFQSPKYSLLEKRDPMEVFSFIRDIRSNDIIQFDKLHIVGPFYDEMCSEQIQILMDGIRVDDFYMTMESEGYWGPFWHRKLKLEQGDWVGLDNLKSMKCEELTVTHSRLTAVDLNTLIRDWLHGDLPQLEHCFFRFRRPMPYEHLKYITEGIETTQWHPPLRELRCWGDFTKFCYVQHEDGEKAFLDIGKLVFGLHVWRQ